MTEQTENPTETPHKPKTLGCFKAGKAFTVLFQKALPYLTKNELEFLAGADSWVDLEMDYMSNILESIGLAAMDQKDVFDRSMPDLIFKISHHYEHLNGIMDVASNAKFLLDSPDDLKHARKVWRFSNESQIESEEAHHDN